MADTKTPKERLLIALRKGQPERVMALIAQFPDELSVDMAADSADNRLLHRAARFGHAQVVRQLCNKGADPKALNKFGMTALHHGAVHGGAEVLQALIDGGCEVNRPDAAGRLPLHWTATKGHVAGARTLLDKGAKAAGADKEGFTPLHRCCQEEPVERREGEEETEEEKVARRRQQDNNKAEIAEILIGMGADVNARELQGSQTPLHLAAMNGLEQVAAVLVRGGADINSVNKIGQTPLIYSCIEQQLPVAKLLLQAGADPSRGNPLHWDWAPLHWATLADNLELVQAVAAAGGRNVADRAGRLPLDLAEEHRKLNVHDFLTTLPV